MHPHLCNLCLSFPEASWSRVQDFKVVKILGQVEVFKCKYVHDWHVGGSMEEREELVNILAGIIYSSLQREDILALGPDSKGVFSMVVGYQVLDSQKYGGELMPWWKYVWNKFA